MTIVQPKAKGKGQRESVGELNPSRTVGASECGRNDSPSRLYSPPRSLAPPPPCLHALCSLVCLFLVVSLLIALNSCAGKLSPGVTIRTAGGSIVDASESIALARGEGAPEYAPQEFARAESLLEEAQKALRKRQSRDALDIAFQADVEAKIAVALAREVKANRRAEEARENKLKIVRETKTDELAAAKARRAIAEKMALESQKEAERANARADKEIQRAEVELAIAKIELELSIYREMVKIDDQTPEDELPPYAKELYIKANSQVKAARTALAADDFQKATTAAEEAAGYISNASVQAKAKLETEAEESLRRRDKVVAAIAKAEVLLEVAEETAAVIQYAEDIRGKAEKALEEAKQALEGKEYDRAETLAEQARVSASSVRAVAESRERETRAREAQEDAKANVLDAVAKAERAIAEAHTAGAAELASDTYNQAQAALDRARQVMLEEDFEVAFSLARDSISYSATALATARAKTDQKRKIEEIENNIMEEARKIPETSVRKMDRGVVISMGGALFDQGSSQIRSDAHTRLKMVAELLKKYPDYKIIIEGHTDNTGSEEANLKISSERAYNFLKYMADREGIPLERLSSVGYGESRPITSNTDEAGRKQNRRVDIVILTAPVSP